MTIAREEKIAANRAREAKKRLAQLNRLAAICNDVDLKADIAFLTTRTEVDLEMNKRVANRSGRKWRI